MSTTDNARTLARTSAHTSHLRAARKPYLADLVDRLLPWGPVSRQRVAHIFAIYTVVCVTAIIIIHGGFGAAFSAFGLGLLMPGAGFLAWAATDETLNAGPILFALTSLIAFGVANIVWIATGNVLLPPIVWVVTALLAALAKPETMSQAWSEPLDILPVVIPCGMLLAFGTTVIWTTRARRKCKTAQLPTVSALRPAAQPQTPRCELSIEDLQLTRLLLDRALQPVDQFEGFEWLDQFQTAAVRYQINFSAYALSMVSHSHLPAARAYMQDAQRNLTLKMLDHRIWRYWRLENAWGNLSNNGDPIGRDNIMLSGFLGLQLAMARRTVSLTEFDKPASLAFVEPSGRRHLYDHVGIIEALRKQYVSAPYGLIACEPNWIYPLCNAITASGIAAFDAQHQTSHWASMKANFQHQLETEFLGADGRLLPVRSSLTGFAPPAVGGAVMQALPCLFLNSTLPDVAEQQWQIVRERLQASKARRHLWPIDVGNYRFSRASSYAASAAGAVEMADSDTAERLLAYLDEDCPRIVTDGVAHRPNASLWAHAIELLARTGSADALRTLSTQPPRRTPPGPEITKASYPEVLIAKATSHQGSLDAVFYPGRGTGYQSITIGGLNPRQGYLAEIGGMSPFHADANGEAVLNIPLSGRTELRVTPVT